MAGSKPDQDLKRDVEKNLRIPELKRLATKLLRAPTYQTQLYERDPMILSFVKDVVMPELSSRGVRDMEIDEMGNLIARMKAKRGGPSLMLLGYAMTAAAGTMDEPLSGQILDGSKYGYPGEVAWGRGACEQKGSLASAIESLYITGQSGLGPAGELVFVLSTAGETGRHDSLKQIVEVDKVKTDRAIVTLGEPTIQLGHKGRIDVNITVEGKPCHSSTPWDGINAIEGMTMVLERLKGLTNDPAARSHPQLGKATLTPTAIESFPKATHTVQATCTLTLDRRLLPGDDPAKAFSEIREAIGSVEPFRVRVEQGAFMYPSEVSKDSGVVRLLADSIRQMLLSEPAYSYMHAAIDTGYLNVHGIEAANFGAGNMKLAHTDADFSSVEDMVNAAKVYAYAAMKGSAQ